MKLKLNIQKFSASNQTTHYDLSQYTANDTTSYLIDYNGDMYKIDSAIYGADSRSLVNESAIGTMSNLNTTDKSSLVGAVNEVNTEVGTNTTTIGNLSTQVSANTGNIGTMANLDTTDKTNLVNAVNEVNTDVGNLSNLNTTDKTSTVNAINEIINKFNFNYKNNLQFTVTVESGSNPTISQSNTRLNSAYNDDGSIGKIYGNIELTGGGAQNTLSYLTVSSNDTGLRPSSNITLDGCAFMSIQGASGDYNRTRVITYTLKTNGTIEISNLPIWANEVRNISFIADLIFATDFGDSPVTPN